MLPYSSDRRGGFTLIELLMVIAIIGILAGLSAVAVRYAYLRVLQFRIQFEIEQLSQGLHHYKEHAREFPPCFGEAVSEGDEVLMKRFVRHLNRAFSEYAPLGSTEVQQYDNIKQYIAENYFIRDPLNPQSVIPLNLDNLVLNRNRNGDIAETSHAEALVFWLAGMPMPIDPGQDGDRLNIGSRKTFGFNTNPENPFQLQGAFPPGVTAARRRELMLSKRTPRLFDFDESRLVDLDHDGWLEYVPPGEDGTGSEAHPYVYFDALTYARPGAGGNNGSGQARNSPGYRPYIHPNTRDAAVPYAMGIAKGQTLEFASGSSIQWMGHGFQIICGGLDSRYGVAGETKTLVLLPNQQSPTAYSAGGYLTSVAGELQPISKDEEDNQVSFSDSLVKDIQPK